MDMLVALYSLPQSAGLNNEDSDRFEIRRALSYEKHAVLESVSKMFPQTPAWGSECDIAFSRQPISCFIATIDAKLVGFSCYDVTFKGFFGPVGISQAHRGKGIGSALTLQALRAMDAQGYKYAVIGQVADPAFFKHIVDATIISNSTPGPYAASIGIKKSGC